MKKTLVIIFLFVGINYTTFCERYFVVCAFVSDNKIIPAIFTLETLIFSYKTVPCRFFTAAFFTFKHNIHPKKLLFNGINIPSYQKYTSIF